MIYNVKLKIFARINEITHISYNKKYLNSQQLYD